MCAFATNNTPWGKTGQKVTDKFMPVEDVMKAAGLDYNISLHDVYLETGEQVPKCKAVRRDDNNKILSTVGDRFHVIQNMECFNWFNSFVEAKTASIENVGSFFDGRIVFVQAKIETPPIEIVKNDPIDAFITLLHSNTGSTSLNCSIGAVRFFCTNQMSLFKSTAKILKMKHTKNVKLAMSAVKDTINIATRDFEISGEQYKYLASKGCSKSDMKKYIKDVFSKDKEDESDMRESRIEEIEYLYECGKSMDNLPHSPYRAYSAISEYLTWNSNRTEDSRLVSLWNGTNNQLNSKALELAMVMANSK